jgi:hypothetical protein
MYPEASWQKEIVKKPEDILDFDLYSKTHLPEVVADVELSRIVGTDHCRYYGKTWVEMLYNLSRANASNAIASENYQRMVITNQDHSQGKQPITVRQYGEEYVLCQSGNNRVCHAKFLGIPTLRIRVQQYLLAPVAATQPREETPASISLWERLFSWVFE